VQLDYWFHNVMMGFPFRKIRIDHIPFLYCSSPTNLSDNDSAAYPSYKDVPNSCFKGLSIESCLEISAWQLNLPMKAVQQYMVTTWFFWKLLTT
jgi:hypothetical protein